MKKAIISIVIIISAYTIAFANKRVFHTGINPNPVELFLDGKSMNGGWRVSPKKNPDVLETIASEVVFVSDKDTLVIDNLKEWESFDFVILTNEGDSAHVRVDRKAANPFENPNPGLLKVANSGRLSKEQAEFDIDALVYGLSQVHPDIFSVCKQEDFLRAVNHAKATLPDSVNLIQLYQVAAPIVAMIGDGHTNLLFPTNRAFTKDLRRFPVYVDVLTDGSVVCSSSLDSIIGHGDKILSINNIGVDSILKAMMPLVSGERPHLKLSRIDTLFPSLFQLLFSSDKYDVTYQSKGTNNVLTYTFPSITWEEIKKRCPSTKSGRKYDDYSYSVDNQNNVAIMDFREFADTEKMEHFADSMFTDLTNRKISNLIIDIRNNGGGVSTVGDVLLRYISPEPFIQMDKALVRISPLTIKLMGDDGIEPMFVFQEADSTHYIKPRSIEEGHYTGNVYLLTSNKTFSAAGSFAWTFKECGMGKVIGEETGGMNVSYGDIVMYTLPISKLRSSISFKRFWQVRANENYIHGTIPDIEVPASNAYEEAMKCIKNIQLTH